MEKITSLSMLKREAKKGVDVAILLNFNIKSCKHVKYYKDGSWIVESNIDDTKTGYATDKELAQYTNIIKALEKGSLVIERK